MVANPVGKNAVPCARSSVACAIVALVLLGCGGDQLRLERAIPVGVWAYDDPSAAVQAILSRSGVPQRDPSETVALRTMLASVRFDFSRDGTVRQRPVSPWDSARWARKGNHVVVTMDRMGDIPGPMDYGYEVRGERLVDLVGGEGLTLRRVAP